MFGVLFGAQVAREAYVGDMNANGISHLLDKSAPAHCLSSIVRELSAGAGACRPVSIQASPAH